MITSESPEQTRDIAARFARSLPRGAVVAITGELGAGKTHFVQGLAQALGCPGPVTSPTFTLVHEYLGTEGIVYHVDLYRLENARETLAIGLDEIWGAGRATLIEWPERLGSLLPADALRVSLRIVSETRRDIDLPGIPPSAAAAP